MCLTVETRLSSAIHEGTSRTPDGMADYLGAKRSGFCAHARPKFAQRCAKVPDELARYDSVLTSFSGPSSLFVGKNRVVFLLEEPSSLFVGNVVQHPNQFAVDASRFITDGETVARRKCWKAGRYRMRGNLHDIVHHQFNASCHARTPDVLPRGLCRSAQRCFQLQSMREETGVNLMMMLLVRKLTGRPWPLTTRKKSNSCFFLWRMFLPVERMSCKRASIPATELVHCWT